MSIDCLKAVAALEMKDGLAKLLLFQLADFANGEKKAFPSKRTLERLTGLSQASIKRKISFLVENGFLVVEYREHQSSVYFLTVGDAAHSEPLPAHSETPPAHPEPPLDHCEPPPAHSEPQNLLLNQSLNQKKESIELEPPKARRTKNLQNDFGLAADFEEFWKFYPKRKVRDMAEKAYAKARGRVSKEELHKAVELYAKEREGQDPTFTPHATTWLNQSRWKDVNVNSTQAAPKNIFGAQIPPHPDHTINEAEILASRIHPKDPSEWPTEEETQEEFERFMALWPKKERCPGNKDHEVWRSVRSRWEAEDIFWELDLYRAKVHDWTQRELPWAYRWLEKFFLILPNERLTIKTKQHRNENVIQHEGRMN